MKNIIAATIFVLYLWNIPGILKYGSFQAVLFATGGTATLIYLVKR